MQNFNRAGIILAVVIMIQLNHQVTAILCPSGFKPDRLSYLADATCIDQNAPCTVGYGGLEYGNSTYAQNYTYYGNFSGNYTYSNRSCQACASGYSLSYLDGRCLSVSSSPCGQCPIDKQFCNTKTSTCEECPQIRPYFDSIKNDCVKTCSPQIPVPDSINNECRPCPYDTPIWNSASNTCEACPSQEMSYGYYYYYWFSYGPYNSGLNRWNWKNKTCVAYCPDNLPIQRDYQGGAYCSRCPEATPVWNSATQTCNSCPNNQPYWNPSAQTCVSVCSAPNQKLNSVTKTCGATCNIATPYWDSQTGMCKVCPTITPKYNGQNDACEACPSDKPKWENNACVPCPTATPKWENNVCVSCPLSTPRWDNKACVFSGCVSPTIKWDVQRNPPACVECPTEKPFWSSSTDACVTCPITAPYWLNYNQSCVSKCDSDVSPILNNLTKTCQTCPIQNLYWDGQKCNKECPPEIPAWSGFRCQKSCIQQLPYLNKTSKRCESCPLTSIFWDNSTLSCVTKCPVQLPFFKGQLPICLSCSPNRPLWNDADSKCDPCPQSIPYWDRLRQKCVQKCPIDQFYLNQGVKTCTTCPISSPNFNSETGNCEACSVPNPSYDSLINACVTSCPSSRSDQSGKYCPPCPSNTPKWNSITQICEGCSVSTPNWDAETQTCVSKCPGQKTVLGLSKQCVKCPMNTPAWNIQTSKCEACPGENPFWDQMKKICTSKCSGGRLLFYGISRMQLKCFACPFLTPRWNNQNQACQSCPQTTPKWNNKTLVCEACPADTPIFKDGYCFAGNGLFGCLLVNKTQSNLTCSSCILGFKNQNGKCIDVANQCIKQGKYFNGQQCAIIVNQAQTTCLTGYTFVNTSKVLCTLCDLGYEQSFEACRKISCLSIYKSLFNGTECVYYYQSCGKGYAYKREDPFECNICDLGYKKFNAKCVQIVCESPTPKFNGVSCVASTQNCHENYTTSNNSLYCDRCAPEFERADGGCLRSCGGNVSKFDGTKCVSPSQPCAINFKDNGFNKCIPVNETCPFGYLDNGNGSCSRTCAVGFRDNGLGKCVNTNVQCSNGFIKRFDKCVIPSASVLRALSTIQADPTLVCDPLCAICDSTGNCFNCRPGFALTLQRTCTPCQNCQTCQAGDPKACTSCFAPLALNADNKTCQAVNCPIPNCIQCSLFEGNCIECVGGYRPQQKSCVPCIIPNCLNCLMDINQCQDCSNNFVSRIISSTNRIECVPCTVGCLGCSLQDLSKCKQCISGYYIAKDQKLIDRCYKCLENCIECNTAGTCSLCSLGYTLSPNKTSCSVACSPNCATCNPGFPDQCQSCYHYATLRVSNLRCQINLNCNLNSTCTACPDGYTLSGNKCNKCQTSDRNCAACTSQAPTVCAKCLDRYFLSNQACEICKPPCSSCVADGVCLSCVDGYYLATTSSERSATSVCKLCSPICLTCTQGPDFCASCSNTSNLVSKTCVNYTNIDIQATMVDINIDKFSDIANQLLQYILTEANKGLDINDKVQDSRSVVLSNLTNGSSVWRVKLSTRNRNALMDIERNVQSALNNNNQKKYVFKSQKVSANLSAQSIGPTSAQLRLILGIGIPMGVLLIVMIVVVIVCLRKRKLDNLYKAPYVPTYKENDQSKEKKGDITEEDTVLI